MMLKTVLDHSDIFLLSGQREGENPLGGLCCFLRDAKLYNNHNLCDFFFKAALWQFCC